MNILRQSTAIVVRIGPFVDVTNAVTPETGITLGAADQAEALKANGAATVDISGATWAAVTGSAGWYDLSLTTSHTDTVGELVIVVQDESVCLPVYKTFQVIEEAAYDALFAASAPGYVANAPVNVAQISGDSGAADNAEAFFDGTGYAGTNNVIPTVTAVTTVNGLAANTITAASVAVGAFEADAFASGALMDAAAVATAVWNAATASYGGAGTYGQALEDVLDDTGSSGVVVASGSKTGYTLTATTGLGNQTANITGNLSGSVGSVTGAVGSVTGNVGGNVTGSVGSVAAGGITASSIAADAIGASELAADAVAEIADAVWDELISGHAISGSTGAALSAAGGSGDPWSTALPGAYGAGTAGKIIGDNINATISSRLASASYTAPLDAAGVRTALGMGAADLDDQLDALPTAAENSTAVWTSTLTEAYAANGAGFTGAQGLYALHQMLMSFVISGATYTVKKLDGSTTAFVVTLNDATTPTGATRA